MFLMPRVCDDIAWSTTEYVAVAAIWIIAWIVGVTDSARCVREQTGS